MGTQKKKSLSTEFPTAPCKGFGHLIDLNFHMGYSGKKYFLGMRDGIESAWSVNCNKKTANHAQICLPCKAVSRSETVKKKAQRIKARKGIVSKYTPCSLYPVEAKAALIAASKSRRSQARKIK